MLQSEQGWHVAGGFFPGTPFMLHGHNEHLGWANTVNDPDLVDIYRLTINPANDNQYRLDGKWRDFETADAAIRVKIFGPLIWTVHRPVLFSAQGPVFKTDHGVFAVRYAGMGEVRQVLQYYRLNKARNLDEWKAAMRLQALPSINYIYADEKGNIGYVYNGQFPVRKDGVNWQILSSGRSLRSDLAFLSAVRPDAAAVESEIRLRLQLQQHAVPGDGAGGRSEGIGLSTLDGHSDQHDQPRDARAGNIWRRQGNQRGGVPQIQIRHPLQRKLRSRGNDRGSLRPSRFRHRAGLPNSQKLEPQHRHPQPRCGAGDPHGGAREPCAPRS